MNICNELRVSLFLQARVISSFHFISPFSSFFLLRGSGAPEPFLFVPQKGTRKDCPSPISPAQTSAPAGDAPLGAMQCPKAPLCKGSWLPLGRLRSCSSNRPRSGLPAWWGRFPLGVPFERAKGTKTRLGRSPLRTSLGYEAGPAVVLRPGRKPVPYQERKMLCFSPFLLGECAVLQVSALSGPPGRRRPGIGRTPPRLEALAMEGEPASGVGRPLRGYVPSM